jgi:hypothetical protein
MGDGYSHSSDHSVQLVQGELLSHFTLRVRQDMQAFGFTTIGGSEMDKAGPEDLRGRIAIAN